MGDRGGSVNKPQGHRIRGGLRPAPLYVGKQANCIESVLQTPPDLFGDATLIAAEGIAHCFCERLTPDGSGPRIDTALCMTQRNDDCPQHADWEDVPHTSMLIRG